jgi:hypothetical protein
MEQLRRDENTGAVGAILVSRTNALASILQRILRPSTYVTPVGPGVTMTGKEDSVGRFGNRANCRRALVTKSVALRDRDEHLFGEPDSRFKCWRDNPASIFIFLIIQSE